MSHKVKWAWFFADLVNVAVQLVVAYEHFRGDLMVGEHLSTIWVYICAVFLGRIMIDYGISMIDWEFTRTYFPFLE